MARSVLAPSHRFRAVPTLAAVATLSAAILIVPARADAATPVSVAGANWIWYPEGDARVSAPVATRYFRRAFSVAAGVVSDAQLVVTADDTVNVWVNGIPLAASPRAVDSWKQALYVDLAPAVRAETNVVAVAVRNTGAGPAGLIARLQVVAGGGTVSLVSDATWKAAQTVPVGWEQSGFNDSAWPAAANLGAYGSGPWQSSVIGPDLNVASPLTVAAATVEHVAAPLGVDAVRPRFGWRLTSSVGQLTQSAYQVIVATSAANADANTGDVWNSGRVASQSSVDVVYNGPTPAALTRYFWRVRVWDGLGRTGPWSATRSFEMGLTDPATQWTAGFIGQATPPVTLSGANWIWYPEGDPVAGVPPATRYFRRTFTLGSAPSAATLVVTGDDTADVWVNGVQVSTSPRVTDSWKRAASIDVAARLTAGTNTVAISSQNTTQSPAGMIAKLVVGGATTAVTDASWKAFASAPAGWQNAGFNDSGWPAARSLASYGAGPWGTNVVVGRASPLLRKSFTISKAVSSARLLVTALGLHETRLNGAKVGTETLAPGWTDYAKRLQYRVHDVTGQLRSGANAIGAYLGNGWFSGSLGFAGAQRYGSQPWYSAQLVVRFTDGTSTTVQTDNSWRVADGPIRSDDLYGGETYDARATKAGFDSPGFDDSGWAVAAVRTAAKPPLVSQVDPGVTVQQELRPIAVSQPQPGVWVLDLGQNFAGWNRLRVRGPAGTTVTMRHAEVLNPNGTIYTANLRAAAATDRFTLAGTGADELYAPRFTVHGYRYVELTGFPGAPTADSVTGLAAWTSGGATGTLTTSSTLINQIQRLIVWGERSNMLSVPTDCPQRDERLGWTGDIAAFVATATFNIDVHGFLDKFADDLTDAQLTNGAFTDVAPAVCCGAGTAGWGDAGVIVPYTLWQRYGDLGVVNDHFDAMARWVDYLRGTSGPDLIRNQATYGDWLNVNDNTAGDLISTAYFGWSARLVARMAAATGRTAEASTYGALADQVAAAFRSRFVAADGTVSGNTQTGYVLAFTFGLVSGTQARAAADKLAAKVAGSGGHLTVGFLGVEGLLPALADNGHLDTAYQVLLQPGFPGWGYMVGRGATTIWERWDGIRTDGSFNDPGMNSFNHYGLGSVGNWLYQGVGGLAPASPGYQRLIIEPKVGGGLTSARAAQDTVYGQAVSDWSLGGGTLTLRVTVPANATATVRVPAPSMAAVTPPAEAMPITYTGGAASFHLPAGSYVFTATQ